MRAHHEIHDRWNNILINFIGDLDESIQKYNKIDINDDLGDRARTLVGEYRMIGILEFILKKNITCFKNNLIKSVNIYSQTITDYDTKRRPIDPSYVTMKTSTRLLDALATGDIQLALDFSKLLGGRLEEEKYAGTQFWDLIGYSLKFVLEGCTRDKHSKSGAPILTFTGQCERDIPNWPWIEFLRETCEENTSDLVGLADIFDGILDNNLSQIQKGFALILKAHATECQDGGLFFGFPDEDLFVWAVGLANLCRYKGFDVQIDNPLVPKGLLISVNVVPKTSKL